MKHRRIDATEAKLEKALTLRLLDADDPAHDIPDRTAESGICAVGNALQNCCMKLGHASWHCCRMHGDNAALLALGAPEVCLAIAEAT